MHKIILAVLVYLFCTQVQATHYNTRNLLEVCKADTSFNSNCHTYLGGMMDMMIFFSHSTLEERIKALCLLQLPTKKIVDTVGKLQLRESDPWRTTDFLVAEYCD